MFLYDFIFSALEKSVECRLWDVDTEAVIFNGTIADIPSQYNGWKIGSWEIIEDGKIGLNIYYRD